MRLVSAADHPVDWFDPGNWPVLMPEKKPDDVCFLQLSDRTDCYCTLDRQDYEWARQWKWCHTYGSGQMVEVAEGVFAIARPDHIYARRCEGGKMLFLHREILLRAKGKPYRSTYIGDHKNGYTLDNRRENLRWATRRQNARNTPGSVTRTRFLRQMGRR